MYEFKCLETCAVSEEHKPVYLAVGALWLAGEGYTNQKELEVKELFDLFGDCFEPANDATRALYEEVRDAE